jgi:hypothetical protein
MSVAPSTSSQLASAALFWHHATTELQRTVAAIGLYLLSWSALSIWIWRRRPALALMAGIGLTLSAGLATSVAVSRWVDRQTPAGVILGSDVAVYKGPGPSYQRQFEQPLQPGVEFTLREQRGPWWRIELPDGKTGWVTASSAELVPIAYGAGLQLAVGER